MYLTIIGETDGAEWPAFNTEMIPRTAVELVSIMVQFKCAIIERLALIGCDGGGGIADHLWEEHCGPAEFPEGRSVAVHTEAHTDGRVGFTLVSIINA